MLFLKSLDTIIYGIHGNNMQKRHCFAAILINLSPDATLRDSYSYQSFSPDTVRYQHGQIGCLLCRHRDK